jgi:hypothetical protein
MYIRLTMTDGYQSDHSLWANKAASLAVHSLGAQRRRNEVDLSVSREPVSNDSFGLFRPFKCAQLQADILLYCYAFARAPIVIQARLAIFGAESRLDMPRLLLTLTHRSHL